MDINFITTQKETILPLNAYGAHLWLEIVYSSLPTTFLARINQSSCFLKFLQQVYYKASTCLVKALLSFLLAHRDEGCSCARESPPRPV